MLLIQSQHGNSRIKIYKQWEEFQKCCGAVSAWRELTHSVTWSQTIKNGSIKTQSKYLITKKEKEKKKYVGARYFSLIKGGICSAKAFGYR